jgi:SAM-dependent MidA family methyltransferase
MELALYHPDSGYYAKATQPVGKDGDYVTSPTLSPVFTFALKRLVSEFLSRAGDGLSAIVDVGCGDGSLINDLARSSSVPKHADFLGIDRSLLRTSTTGAARFVSEFDAIPATDSQLILSNELFDALPFARLVQRGEHLHELWVTEGESSLDWSEHEAEAAYEDYFASRNIALDDGQFADISLDWGALYGELCGRVTHGLIVTFDYGFREKQLFDRRIRRFGTAASYTQQRVTRDLLLNPGGQDLTAHVNFDDLMRAGEARGFTTLFFDRQAKFLLALGITEHELFKPSTELEAGGMDEVVSLLEAREEARRLVLPDGIGEDIRVLVQGRGIPLDGWSFQKKLF